ncbi:MAG: flagellar hook capping FlgD N-terminal domain-containing protein [Rhodospirillales bacterium]
MVDAVDVNALTGASTKAQTSKLKLTDDFDTFLTLLTTQLQNQDPLEPLDTNQFTQQLVEFASVEQLIDQSASLEDLISLQEENRQIGAAAYIGNTIEYDGSAAPLVDGEANWAYVLPSDASSVELKVLDSNGTAVFTTGGSNTAGIHTFNWDGSKDFGPDAAPGNYKLSVVAKNSEGKDLTAEIRSIGKVTGVDLSSGEPLLSVSGILVSTSTLLGVEAPKTTISDS